MKDRFSAHAANYAFFRPTYPSDLYDFILTQVKERKSAWDCGTGNGQVARDLAPHFMQVFATDSSANQVNQATLADNIVYSVCPAEKTLFPESTFDLITVGQAIHWFDIPLFYNEVVRVGKPGAVLAVWGYSLLHVNAQIDPLISDFYTNKVGPFWDPERKLVDRHYETIPFPFEEVHSPEFRFSFQWTLEELEGYITSWSSVQKYMKAHHDNPVELLIDRIRPCWTSEKMAVNFPLFLRCGRLVK